MRSFSAFIASGNGGGSNYGTPPVQLPVVPVGCPWQAILRPSLRPSHRPRTVCRSAFFLSRTLRPRYGACSEMFGSACQRRRARSHHNGDTWARNFAVAGSQTQVLPSPAYKGQARGNLPAVFLRDSLTLRLPAHRIHVTHGKRRLTFGGIGYGVRDLCRYP